MIPADDLAYLEVILKSLDPRGRIAAGSRHLREAVLTAWPRAPFSRRGLAAAVRTLRGTRAEGSDGVDGRRT